MRVAPNALTEAGRISTTATRANETRTIERSLVIGDTLYTLSWLGLCPSNLDNLGRFGFTAFR